MSANRAIAASKVLHCSNVSESAVQELLSFMVAFGKVAFGEKKQQQPKKKKKKKKKKGPLVYM